ncbi:MAG: tryptophan 2,3-dioxygenase family protein [Ignavibacteriaceae bacterium]
MPITYSEYLRLDCILSAQKPLSEGPEHDEMLFIIIHQSYELWFKQLLHEGDYLKSLLVENDVPRSLHTLKRMLTILKVLVHQIDILETMTPLEFLSFRQRLESASGFQSVQFRELEFLLGQKKRMHLNQQGLTQEDKDKLSSRFNGATLWDAFILFLYDNKYEVPDNLLNRDVTEPISPSHDMQKILIYIYKNDHRIAQLCELLVDLDEGFQEWRYRHVKMVERTIGTRKGTGGSEGVAYLRTTLSRSFFPDLWEIRKEFK